MSVEHEEPAPAMWVGPYLLERELGHGSSGAVYLARASVGVERFVAVKQIRCAPDSDAHRRALDEARILSELDHPNILRLLDVVADDDGVALVTQYAPNGTLAGRLAARGPFSAPALIDLLTPVADALASAHRRGIFHSDVKPSNILLTADNLGLLADFDIAAFRGGVERVGVTLGSAAYLAPELLTGSAPSPTSDVYSLGVVAYEALTGRLPFDGPTVEAVLQKSERGVHEVLDPQHFGPLATLVERAMARLPRQRFDSAEDLATAWRAVRTVSASPALFSPGMKRAEVATPNEALLGALRQVAARHDGAASTPDSPASELALDLQRSLIAHASSSPHQDMAIADDELRATTRIERPLRPRTLDYALPVVPHNRARQVRLLAGGLTAAVVIGVGGLVAATRGHGAAVEGGLVAARVRCDPSTSRQCVDKVERSADGVAITFIGDTEPTTFKVGEPTDALRVANWFCGSIETLAAYRPSTGVVYYFESWPLPGQPVQVLADATGITQASGITVADSDGDKCADLGIERDGKRTWFLPVKQTGRLQRVDAAVTVR